MRTKFLIYLLTTSLMILLISSCGRKDTADTVIKEGNTIDVYSVSNDNKEIIVTDTEVEKITDTFINAELQAANVIPTNITIINAYVKDSNEKLIQIDYSENFSKYLNSLTEEEEYLKTTCIVNTFLSAYDCDKALLTSNSESFSTETKDYSNYITFNNDLSNPYYVEIEEEPEIIEVKDEYEQVKTLFDVVDNTYTDNNLLISPISIYASLSILYDGADGETKELIENYIYDIDEIKSDYASLISKSDFNLYNALFYHKGGTDNKICTVNYAKSLENYKTEIYNTNMNLQKTTLDTFNNWVAGKTKNKVTNFLTAIPNTTQLYLVNINQYDLLFNNYTIKQTFTSEDGTEKTISFLELEGTKSYFENDMAMGFEMDINSSKYKLICIMPNNSNTKISDINLSELFSEKSIITKNCYIPIINSINTVKFNTPLSSLELSNLFTTNADFSLMFENCNNKFGVNEIAQINILNINSVYETNKNEVLEDTTTDNLEEIDSENESNIESDIENNTEESTDEVESSSEEIDENINTDEILEDLEVTDTEENIEDISENDIEDEEIEETLTEISSDSIIINKKFYYMIIDNETNQIVFLGKYSK